MLRKARVFWPVSLCLLLADCASKRLAVEHLGVPAVPHEVVGSVLQFTLAYNSGTAFGFFPGPAARVAVALLSLAALAGLFGIYRRAAPGDRALALALGLVAGGAVGNLADRVRAGRVVDFIDAGVGPVRFWTFNVADLGLTVGALLLVALLARRGTASAA